MKEVITFRFNNIEIPFDLDGGPTAIMINVTPIAKAYGKRVNDWLYLDSAKAYLQKLLNTGFSGIYKMEDLVLTVRGRHGGGTWMHQMALVEFSRWVDDDFAIWCNMTILNVIYSKLMSNISERDNIIAQKDMLITQLQSDNTQLQQQISNQQPKVVYFDRVLNNPDPLYSTNDIVKQLGIKVSNRQLLKMMEDDGLIFRTKNGDFYVTARYNKYNFRKAVTVPNPKTGNPMTINKWTEAGKQWIYGLALGYKII